MENSTNFDKSQDAASKLHGRKMDFLRAVRFDRDLTDAAKNVAAVLVDHYGAKEGWSRPPVDLIAFAANLDEKTVRRMLKKLVSGGWFTFGERRVKGRQRANTYTPDWSRSLTLVDLTARWKATFAHAHEVVAEQHQDAQAAPVTEDVPAPVVLEKDRPAAEQVITLRNGDTVGPELQASVAQRLGKLAPLVMRNLDYQSRKWAPGTAAQEIERLVTQWLKQGSRASGVAA